MEEERRLQAFEETLKMVTEHNNEQGNREGGYMLELNRFADMTWCVRGWKNRCKHALLAERGAFAVEHNNWAGFSGRPDAWKHLQGSRP